MTKLNISNAIIADAIQQDLFNQLNKVELVWLNDAIKLLIDTEDKINNLLDLSVVVKRTFTSSVYLNDTHFSAYSTSEIIRVLLIKVALNGLSSPEQAQLLKQYYRSADELEKIAWLKGLSYFDEFGVAVNTAMSASRCNSINEFSALAINNDYAAKHFPELNFNQLVLKSLFSGLDIGCMSNLPSRLNVKLTNMCFSFAVEQALAFRIPPASIWLAVIPEDLDDENTPLLSKYLTYFFQQDDQHKKQIMWFVEHHQLTNKIIRQINN